MIRFLIGITLCLSLLVTVQPARAEGEKIAEVQVNGNRRIGTAAIFNVVKTRSGDQLYAEKVDQDVRAIYQIGQFQDVSADLEKGARGNVLVFTVVEKPLVREIVIKGNKEISEEKIRETLLVKTNTVFAAKELDRSLKKVKKLYSDEGYYLAEVNGSTEVRSDQALKVVISVVEGEKILIKEIAFEGNKAFTPRQLRGVMETKEKWFMSWLTGAGTYKEEELKNDANLIADLYFNNGYAMVKVGEPKVELQPDRKGLKVTVGITEGDQFKTGEIEFRGDLLEPKTSLYGRLKLRSGQVFDRSALRADVTTLTDVYGDQGYAFANVAPLTRLDQNKKLVEITYDLEKGEKVYIDRINITGNTKTRDKVIRREVRLAEGDLYSGSSLKKSKQGLMNLGYFEEASLATSKGSANNKLNLDVNVKEKPTGTFSVGGGYSSLDGFVVQGSVQQANFLGLGLKAVLAASVGGKSSTYNFSLTDPHFLDSEWTLGGDIYRVNREYPDFKKEATGFDIKGGRPLTDTVSAFLVYKLEESKISDVTAGYQYPIEPSGITSAVTATLTRNTTDYRLDPSTGQSGNVSIEFAGLGGDFKFVRYQAENTWYFPAYWSTVFSLRTALGYVDGLSMDVPVDERYYLGGMNSIRGYKPRTVCPVENGIYLGGVKEAIINVEHTFPLLKEQGVKGVLFFDAGNAWGENQDYFSKFQMSYGAGIRWFSPIGPLRLEYGIPLNPRNGIDASSRFEFSIGTSF